MFRRKFVAIFIAAHKYLNARGAGVIRRVVRYVCAAQCACVWCANNGATGRYSNGGLSCFSRPLIHFFFQIEFMENGRRGISVCLLFFNFLFVCSRNGS